MLKRFLVNLTDEELTKLDELLKNKGYSSRSEVFRKAIGLLMEVERSPQLHRVLEKIGKKEVDLRKTGREIRGRIIDFLGHRPGSTISEISDGAGIHRHSVRKYLEELVKLEVVRQKKVGTSKVSYLSRVSRRVRYD